jgi:hypothetical protein
MSETTENAVVVGTTEESAGVPPAEAAEPEKAEVDFEINAQTLVKVLKEAKPYAGRFHSMPILSCVWLDARADGTVRVVATDLESAFRSEVWSADVPVPGRLVVDLDTLVAVLESFGYCIVRMRVGRTRWLRVTGGGRTAELGTEGPEDFPRAAADEGFEPGDWTYDVDGKGLAVAVERSLWSLDPKTSSSNFALGSMNLDWKLGYLYLCTSDSNAMTKMILGESEPLDANVTFDVTVAKRVMRMAELASGKVALHLYRINGDPGGPSNPDDSLYWRLAIRSGRDVAFFAVDRGRFPDPNGLLPDSKDLKAMVLVDDALLTGHLRRMLRTVGPAQEGSYRGARRPKRMATLRFGAEELTVSMKSAERCVTTEERMPCEIVRGGPFETMLTAKDLVGALVSDALCNSDWEPKPKGKARRRTRSLLAWFGPRIPMVIRAENETTKSYIIMATAEKRSDI